MCKKEKNIEKLTYVQNRRKEVINKQCYSVPDKDIFHGVFVKSMQKIDISEIRQKIQSHNVLQENGNGAFLVVLLVFFRQACWFVNW